MVCVREWRHRILGLDTPSRTLELECRACGTQVTLYPQRQIRTERLFAILVLPTIFGGLWLFARARKKARAWRDHPVVDGLSPPRRRGEAPRVCAACRGIAHCTEISRRQTQGISLGTRYRYRCERCSNVFTVHDTRAVTFLFAAGLALAVAGALVVARPPGADVGAQARNRWFGGILLVISALAWLTFALQLRSRRASRPVDPAADFPRP